VEEYIEFEILCCSGIPVQLDRVSSSDVLLPHDCCSVWRAVWVRPVARQVDLDSKAHHRSCFEGKLMALVADSRFRHSDLRSGYRAVHEH